MTNVHQDDGRRLTAGMLLVRAGRHDLDSWLEGSVLATDVLDLRGGWLALVPCANPRIPAPYDDPFALSATRLVPRRFRPALSLAVGPQHGVLVLQRRSLPRVMRWGVWTPEVGLAHTSGLTPLSPGDIASSFDLSPTQADELGDALGHGGGTPHTALARVVDLLQAPAAWLLEPGADPTAEVLPEGAHAHRVRPPREQVDRFVRAVADQVALERELAGP